MKPWIDGPTIDRPWESPQFVTLTTALAMVAFGWVQNPTTTALLLI